MAYHYDRLKEVAVIVAVVVPIIMYIAYYLGVYSAELMASGPNGPTPAAALDKTADSIQRQSTIGIWNGEYSGGFEIKMRDINSGVVKLSGTGTDGTITEWTVAAYGPNILYGSNSTSQLFLERVPGADPGQYTSRVNSRVVDTLSGTVSTLATPNAPLNIDAYSVKIRE